MKRIITISVLLLIGVAVYWVLYPDMYLFKALGIYNTNRLVIINRDISMVVRNYLPDILWVIAIINVSLFMKEKHIPSIYIYLILFLPFLSEILQEFKVIPGTFDWYDLLIYTVAFLISFNSKTILLCKKFISTLPAH